MPVSTLEICGPTRTSAPGQPSSAPPTPTAHAVRRQRTTNSNPPPGGNAVTDRTNYLTTYETELAARRAEADKLRAAVCDTEASRRAKYDKLLDTLHTKVQLAESRIANIRERKEEAWGELRDGAERAREELDQALLAAKRSVMSPS